MNKFDAEINEVSIVGKLSESKRAQLLHLLDCFVKEIFSSKEIIQDLKGSVSKFFNGAKNRILMENDQFSDEFEEKLQRTKQKEKEQFQVTMELAETLREILSTLNTVN